MLGAFEVSDAERKKLEHSGIVFKPVGEWFRAPLPCAAWARSGCTVYDVRPEVCVKFRCALLKAVDAGSVAEAEALATVAQAHRLTAAVNEGLQAAFPGSGESREKQLRDAAATSEGRARHVQLLLDKAALEVHLQRHFRETVPAK
ncbi:hypothetical protein H8R02_12610 [Ramlibacter sp. GTP1]|uniref:YkgJ family cysteine cluster protein n=1 Tax=Ramlibacter albus TaxID=2079448 RepID=A0A923M7S1_9BURK|nr:hypothetical protein [Ramlibacter albus]